MLQIVLTPAAGKRLIAKAIVEHLLIKKALSSGTLTIVAGTTNGYVAEEILKSIGAEGFCRSRFFRGIALPPQSIDKAEEIAGGKDFPGDVVIVKGQWEKGKTIFDVAKEMKEGDIILKGANALDVSKRKAAVLIGHPTGGTIMAALQSVVGKRARLIIPAGLEKRVPGSLDELSLMVNAPGTKGPRLLPVQGEIVTEIDAISILTGAKAELFAAGGVCGAEGSIWLAVSGNAKQEAAVKRLYDAVKNEEPFAF